MRKLIVTGMVLLGLAVGGCSSSDENGATFVSPTTASPHSPAVTEPFTPPPRPTAPDGFALYEGPNGDFQIAYPEDWEILSDLTSNFSAGPKGDDGSLTALVRVVATARPEGEKALAEFLEAQSAYLAGRPGYFSHGTKEITVYGREAQIADYEMISGSVLWRLLTFRMAAGDRIWTVTCSCPVDNFGLNQSRFYQIIGSFYLLGEAVPEPLTPSPEPSPVPVPPLIPGA